MIFGKFKLLAISIRQKIFKVQNELVLTDFSEFHHFDTHY